MNYYSSTEIDNQQHYQGTYAKEFTGAVVNTVLLTPATNNCIRVHDVYIYTSSTSGSCWLEFTTTGYEIAKAYFSAGACSAHFSMRQSGGKDETLRLNIVDSSGTATTFVSINYAFISGGIEVGTTTSTSTSTTSTSISTSTTSTSSSTTSISTTTTSISTTSISTTTTSISTTSTSITTTSLSTTSTSISSSTTSTSTSTSSTTTSVSTSSSTSHSTTSISTTSISTTSTSVTTTSISTTITTTTF